MCRTGFLALLSSTPQSKLMHEDDLYYDLKQFRAELDQIDYLIVAQLEACDYTTVSTAIQQKLFKLQQIYLDMQNKAEAWREV